MTSQIALGTVQFGLDYGVNNQLGKTPYAEVVRILRTCDDSGISTLDTASLYGDSEKVLGRAIDELALPFQVITKFSSKSIKSLKHSISESLKRLRTNSIHGYMFHSFDDYINAPELLDHLQEYKAKGVIKKVGFSLYHPEEALTLLDKNVSFDIIQAPYNLFDRRFEPIFKELKDNNVEIHTRSAFLQGLFFKQIDSLPEHFYSIKTLLTQVRTLFKAKNIPLSAGLLNFVLLNQNIDKVVIGVDSLENLESNLESEKYFKSTRMIYGELKKYHVDDLNIILPTNWKYEK